MNLIKLLKSIYLICTFYKCTATKTTRFVSIMYFPIIDLLMKMGVISSYFTILFICPLPSLLLKIKTMLVFLFFLTWANPTYICILITWWSLWTDHLTSRWGYSFFSKKIFWFPMFLKIYSDVGAGKNK